jgi:DNA-binding SARP family transcriptional activator
MQRRQAGHAIPKLSDELAATETALRASAVESSGPWLDLALRALASELRVRPGDHAPHPVALHLTPDELDITLAEPNTRAPKPWMTSPPGWQWHLPRSTPTVELERLVADACAPMPALITIGSSPDGGPVMLDLEACGLTTITGTPDEARGLVRSAALELAVSPVADELDIVLVGDDPLLPATPTLRQLTHVRTISDAIALMVGPAAATGRALDAAGFATTFAARCANRGTDPWAPTLLIVDATLNDDEREQLEELADASGRGIGILVIGDWNNAPWTLHVTHGQIDAPRLGLQGLTVTIESQDVSQKVADATVQLFEQADDDTDERLLQCDSVGPDVLAEGPGPSCFKAPITVHLLGAVRVEGATRPLTATETELVAYVATREHPVDADIIQTALWPDRTVSPKRWWNLISETRKALGVDDDGNFYLPPLTKGQPLRFGTGVATDLAYIETALRCVHANASAEATSALAVVLGDVTGRPFDTSRGYAWVHANGLASYAEALVVDATHELATRFMDADEIRNATSIIATGLSVSPENEILYRDLILAHDQAGDARAVENAMRDLLEVLEATDPYSDLQPETVSLYERVSGRALADTSAGRRTGSAQVRR